MRHSLLYLRFLRRSRQFIIFSLFIFVFFIIFFFGDLFFKVKEIQVVGEVKQPPIGLSKLKNKNLLFISRSAVEKILKNDNPLIKDILITKIFPSTLKISLSLYQPTAVLEGADVYFYLAEDGRIILKSKRMETTIPIIHYYQRLNSFSYPVGDWISNKDLMMALYFLRAASDLGFLAERVDIGGDDMIVFKKGEKEIFFTTGKDEKTQKYELEQIIKQFRIEGREFKSLDLRFDKPIIRF